MQNVITLFSELVWARYGLWHSKDLRIFGCIFSLLLITNLAPTRLCFCTSLFMLVLFCWITSKIMKGFQWHFGERQTFAHRNKQRFIWQSGAMIIVSIYCGYDRDEIQLLRWVFSEPGHQRVWMVPCEPYWHQRIQLLWMLLFSFFFTASLSGVYQKVCVSFTHV